MRIELQGSRSSDGSWLAAQRAPLNDLPVLTESQRSVARSLGTSEESYARSLYASRLTQPELAQKAEKVVALVDQWLKDNRIAGQVERILLKTFAGMYEIDVENSGTVTQMQISEDVIDDLLQRGQKSAAEALDRLLAANFGRLLISKAS